jgi:glutathione S-transferase
MSARYRLFSWEHSYFSGKVRAYLRYKNYFGDLGDGYEDILATPELIQGLLVPATGSNVVPQVLTPEGDWLHDSSEIIDRCEDRHQQHPVTPGPDRPRQRLAAYLIELLADEWMLVHGFWERWHYSLAGSTPNQLNFNAQQWGAFMNPRGTGSERRATAQMMFNQNMSLDDPTNAVQGPFSGLVELGMTERTMDAWIASHRRIMGILESHFDVHDFVLGGRPSLADFGLLGPLYAHLFRDAVPGFEMRIEYPLVAEWVERTNGTNALNARSYNQQLYHLGSDGELIGEVATSDGGEWLADDVIPPTLVPLIDVFFEEMWPTLQASLAALRAYLDSDAHTPDAELPGKSFTATQGFEALQRGAGPLTHSFQIGGVTERRMVMPYQTWMLQRIAAANDLDTEVAGQRLSELPALLEGCRVKKIAGRLYEDATMNHRTQENPQ